MTAKKWRINLRKRRGEIFLRLGDQRGACKDNRAKQERTAERKSRASTETVFQKREWRYARKRGQLGSRTGLRKPGERRRLRVVGFIFLPAQLGELLSADYARRLPRYLKLRYRSGFNKPSVFNPDAAEFAFSAEFAYIVVRAG